MNPSHATARGLALSGAALTALLAEDLPAFLADRMLPGKLIKSERGQCREFLPR